MEKTKQSRKKSRKKKSEKKEDLYVEGKSWEEAMVRAGFFK